MAVFVRVFRLAMLFFNVYDSYKVLKLPLSSAQNKRKPSLQALSQRKRNMKGCLAVWIVWSCYITYERFAEAVVSLFIPFYDEFKSLILLFLIMTRARGAEPIYLHIIRPFLKPYTSTIDQLLDFVHVIGDVVFGLTTLPFIYAIQWWQRRFGAEQECLDTETEASPSPPNAPTPKCPLPASRTHPSKPVRVLGSSVTKYRQSIPKRSSVVIADQKKAQSTHFPIIKGRPADKPSTRYDLPTSDTAAIDGLPHVDEWRQYPAFPSAYPPTPLVKHNQLAPTTVMSTSAILHSTMPEESARQDFHQSLLPPLNDSNPSFAGDKSDETISDGGQSNETKEITIAVMDVDGNDILDEHMEEEAEYESEDDFNITLRTPDVPLRILTTLGPPATLLTEISPLDLPSRSSALMTADSNSSLCTPSTDYTASDASVLPSTMDDRKRTIHPASSAANPRIQASRLTARGTSVRIIRSARSPVKRAGVTQRRPPRDVTSRPLERPGSQVHENEASSVTVNSVDGEGLNSKRRRVSLSPPNAVQVMEPVRRRAVRPTTATAKTTRVVSTRKPSSFRTSPRPRTKTNDKPAVLSSREGSSSM